MAAGLEFELLSSVWPIGLSAASLSLDSTTVAEQLSRIDIAFTPETRGIKEGVRWGQAWGAPSRRGTGAPTSAPRNAQSGSFDVVGEKRLVMAAPGVAKRVGDYKRLIVPLALAGGGFALFNSAPLLWPYLGLPTDGPAVRAFSYLFGIIAWLGLAWLGARAVDVVLARAAIKAGPQVRIPRLLHDMGRVILFTIAAAAILNFVLGRSATGVLAASGVLVAVLGFALRGLIADIFSGLALSHEHPYRIGDWIEVASGAVGQVMEIDWRATRLVTRDGFSMILPNGLVAAGKLVNYSCAERRYRAKLQVALDATIPVERAKRILLTGAIGADGVLPHPPPQVQVQDFGDRGVTYVVLYWVADYAADQSCRDAVASGVLRSLHRSGLAPASPKQDVVVARQRAIGAQLRPSRRALMEQVELFQALTEEERTRLADLMVERTYVASSTVVRQGDRGASLFLLAEGVLDVHSVDGATPIRLDRLLPGEIFGEISLLTGQARSASVTAATDAIVFQIAKEHLEPILHNRPELAIKLAEVMEKHLRHNEERRRVLSMAERTPAPAQPTPTLMRRICAFFGLPEPTAAKPPQSAPASMSSSTPGHSHGS